MKIGVVIERMETWRGGAETSAMEIARLLTERGHELHIITSSNVQSLPDIAIHSLSCPKVLRSRRMGVFARKTADFLNGRDFDVVHAISPLPCADVYQPRGGLLAETMARNVATRSTASRRLLKRALMAMNVKQRSLLELERRIFRDDGPVIAAVSEYVARQCGEVYGAASPRVRVVFNGIHFSETDAQERRRLREEIRRDHGIAEDALMLLFVAHNFRLKGLYPLLDIASRLVVSGFKEFRLVVAGRDNVVPFQRRASALGLDDFVTFVGPTKRVTSLLFGADVCVHPTYYDPCSRVVLEALSLGVPVITTMFNGAAEVIQDGREGFVIESPENVGLWARRIEDLAAPELRSRMSERALALREKISMARHVGELEAVFAEVVERKRCSASGA